MAKMQISDRERFALTLILNPMQHATRADRKRVDRLWASLGLDGVQDKVEKATRAMNHLDFSDERAEVEVTSDERDLIIDVLSRPGLNTAIGRLLNPMESELIRSRDG